MTVSNNNPRIKAKSSGNLQLESFESLLLAAPDLLHIPELTHLFRKLKTTKGLPQLQLVVTATRHIKAFSRVVPIPNQHDLTVHFDRTLVMQQGIE